MIIVAMKTGLHSIGIINALRWAGRVMALLVFLFWRAFFVEHMWEWLINPYPNVPPPKVWVGRALHFLILLGLLLVMRWPLVGAILVFAASVAFFSSTAGSNAPLFIGMTCLPAVLLLFCWWATRHGVKLPEPAKNL